MRLPLLACVLFLLAAAVSAAAPPRSPHCDPRAAATTAATVHPADIIGYVTAKQIQAARGEGLAVSELDARQRQHLPKTGPATRIKFFKKSKGRYGVVLIAPPMVEEYKP